MSTTPRKAKSAPKRKPAKKAQTPRKKILGKRQGIGRPSPYKPEYADQARQLAMLGANDIEISDFFGVSDRTIYRWANQHEDFCRALKLGKDEADERVLRSLYHKATGYTFESEKIFCDKGRVTRVRYREHVPPDTTACIFWLKNRRRDDFREKLQDTNGADSIVAILQEIADKRHAERLAQQAAKTIDVRLVGNKEPEGQ